MVRKIGLPLTAAIAVMLTNLVACGENIPVGQQHETPKGQEPALQGEDDGYCVDGADFEPTVQWEGHVENGIMPITAERIRIQPPASGKPGFVMFGSGPKLPAPTDPKVAYPCGDSADFWLRGHQYTIMNSDITAHRMRFTIWMQEPFNAWCELQSPQPGGIFGLQDCTSYQCSFCTCRDDGCKALSSEKPLVAASDGWYARFDITLEGETADGSVQGLVPDISASTGGPVERIRLYAVDAD